MARRLNIEIIEAQNLIKPDPDSPLDPYVIIKLKNQDKNTFEMTQVINNTTNPVWNQTFNILAVDPNDVLLINIYDKGIKKDVRIMDELQFPVNIWEIEGKREKKIIDLKLKKKKNFLPAGRLIFAIKALPPSEPKPRERNDITVPVVQTDGCRIHIKAFEGKDLIKMGVGAKSDPYLQFNIKGIDSKKVKTNVITKTQCPVWNEELDILAHDHKTDILEVNLIDHDLNKNEKMMNPIFIPISEHPFGDHYVFDDYIKLKNKNAGKLHFELDFNPVSEKFIHPVKQESLLPQKEEEIKSSEKIQEPVKTEEEPVKTEEEKPVKTEEEPIKTEEEPIKTEEEPVKTEEAVKTEEEPIKTEEEKPVKMEEEPVKTEEPIKTEEEPIKTEEEKPVKSEEEPIKTEEEPIKTEEDAVKVEEPEKNEETTKVEELNEEEKAEEVPVQSRDIEIPQEKVVEEPKPKVQGEVCKLVVKVVKGENLLQLDEGSRDPYVSLQIKGDDYSLQKTRTVDHSANPVWDESYEFHINDRKTDVLLVNLYDEGIRTDGKMMNQIEFPLKEWEIGTHVEYNQDIKLGPRDAGKIYLEFDIQKEEKEEKKDENVAEAEKQEEEVAVADKQKNNNLKKSAESIKGTIVMANGLPKTNSNGSDTYVVLSVLTPNEKEKKTEKVKTGIFRNTQDPVWNRDFEFGNVKNGDYLRVEVFQSHKIRGDQCFAYVDIPVDRIKENEPAEQRYKLEKPAKCPKYVKKVNDLGTITLSLAHNVQYC